jgi:predicted sugar kinase
MKYFKEGRIGRGYGKEGIILEEHIFSLSITEDNKIEIMEECDAFYQEVFTKEQAIEMLEEAVTWIKNNA